MGIEASIVDKKVDNLILPIKYCLISITIPVIVNKKLKIIARYTIGSSHHSSVSFETPKIVEPINKTIGKSETTLNIIMIHFIFSVHDRQEKRCLQTFHLFLLESDF